MEKLKVVLTAVVILMVAGGVYAQNYPTQPVRMIVPFAPGGASDIVARIVSPALGKELGQQIVVDNRGGASGNLGVDVAARATPDGHTILLGEGGAMALNPSLFPNFPIKPLNAFIAVSQIVEIPGVMVVHPSVPVATLAEFIEYAKARPGKLNHGSAGIGSPYRLATEYFANKAGLKITHVPYAGGAGPAMIGILSGEVQMFLVNTASCLQNIKDGKLKPLMVVATKRLEALPDIPTMIEAGFPEMAAAWQGVYVPVGTPHSVVTTLFNALKRTMADPGVVKRLRDMSASVTVSNTPEDFTEFTKKKTEFYARIIKEIGLVTQ
jgi:tripartite-type tricarboxylate transporter receptor subunit TctC